MEKGAAPPSTETQSADEADPSGWQLLAGIPEAAAISEQPDVEVELPAYHPHRLRRIRNALIASGALTATLIAGEQAASAEPPHHIATVATSTPLHEASGSSGDNNSGSSLSSLLGQVDKLSQPTTSSGSSGAEATTSQDNKNNGQTLNNLISAMPKPSAAPQKTLPDNPPQKKSSQPSGSQSSSSPPKPEKPIHIKKMNVFDGEYGGERIKHPTAIVEHDWGGDGNGKPDINFLINTLERRNLSVQFGVTKDGEIYQLSKHANDVAWQAKCANGYAIGVENQGKAGHLTQAEIDADARLNVYLMKKYPSIKPDENWDDSKMHGITSHKHVDPHCAHPSGKIDVSDKELNEIQAKTKQLLDENAKDAATADKAKSNQPAKPKQPAPTASAPPKKSAQPAPESSGKDSGGESASLTHLLSDISAKTDNPSTPPSPSSDKKEDSPPPTSTHDSLSTILKAVDESAHPFKTPKVSTEPDKTPPETTSKAPKPEPTKHEKPKKSHEAQLPHFDAAKVPKSFRPWIEKAAETYGLDPAFLAAQLQQESGFHAHAVSSAGAEGPAQFMPKTLAAVGVDADHDGKVDPYSIPDAVMSQGNLMSSLIKAAKESNIPGKPEALALAGYNAGWHRVIQYHGVPPESFADGQTYNYVKIIMGNIDDFKK
jgi:hypothetical protein